MRFTNFCRIGAVLALSLVAACTAPPAKAPGFRDPAAPFASTSRFEVDRFLGTWQRVAVFAAPDAAVSPQTHLYRRATSGQIIEDVTAPDGSTRRNVYQVTAPGRLLAQSGDAAPEALWLLWVDEGYRTAVLGTPTGTKAFILDRASVPSPDRLRAAREILDWYGYDLGLLRPLP